MLTDHSTDGSIYKVLAMPTRGTEFHPQNQPTVKTNKLGVLVQGPAAGEMAQQGKRLAIKPEI